MSSASRIMVAEASEPIERGIWLDALRQAGIEATTFERGVGAAIGGAQSIAPTSYPILVPSARIADARNIIAELAGAERLVPAASAAEQVSRVQRWTIAGIAGVLAFLLMAVIVQAVS